MKNKKQLIAAIAIVLLVASCGQPQTTDDLLKEASIQVSKKNIQSAIITLKNVVREEPKNPSARLMLAASYLTTGNLKGAQKEVDRAIEYGAEAAETLILNLKIKLQQGEYDQVILAVENKRHEFSAKISDEINLYLAYALMGANELDEKRFVLAKLNQSNNTFYQNQSLLLGFILDKKEEQAKQVLKELNSNEKLPPETLRFLGNLAFYFGQYNDATNFYTEYGEHREKDYKTFLMLSQSLINEEKDDEAMAFVDRILKVSEKHALSSQLKAIILFKSEAYEEAVFFAEQAIAAGLESNIARLIAGVGRFYMEHFEQANNHLSMIVNELSTGHPVKRLYLATQLQLGNKLSNPIDIADIDINTLKDTNLLTTTGLEYVLNGEIGKARELLNRSEQHVKFDNTLELVRRGILKNEMDLGGGIEDLESALLKEPNNRKIQLTLALSYFQSRKYRELIDMSTKYQSEALESAIWYNLAAQSYDKLKEYDKAEEVFRKLLTLDSTVIAADLFFIDQNIRAENWLDAKRKLEALVTTNIFDKSILLRYYSVTKQLGDVELALTQIKKQIKYAKNINNAKVFLARLLFAEKRVSEVIELLESVTPDSQTSEHYWKLLTSSLLLGQNYEKVSRVYQQWIDSRPISLMAWSNAVSFRVLKKEYNIAIELLDRAIINLPAMESLKFQRINVLLKAKELDKAEGYLNALSKVFLSTPAAQGLRGRLKVQKGEYEAGLPLLKNWHNARNSVGSCKLLALTYSSTNQAEKAIALLEKCLNKWEVNEELSLMLADLYNASNPSKALSLWLKIIDVNNKNIIALNNAAWGYFKIAKYNESEELIEQALILAPSNIYLIDTYLNVLQKSGRKKKFVGYLDSIKKSFGTNSEIQDLINKFEN